MRPVFVLLVLIAAFWPGSARPHEMTMAELVLRETSRGEFLWNWSATEQVADSELSVLWPEPCQAEESVVHCGQGGLRGRLEIAGLGKSFSVAVVRIFWSDGRNRVYSLTATQPDVQLFGSADDERGAGEVAGAYLALGVEHILTGYDHLAFVLALLVLVGINRRLVFTLTAFTVAHSVTLALSALGWITLRPPPVEATIALSLVLVAREGLHPGDTWTRRWPALVAFLFGLVHGLGFAGALKEIGLPQQHLSMALLTFNVGVEVGQLLVVALAIVVTRLAGKRFRLEAGRSLLLYVIGATAAYWTISRVAAMVA